MTGRTDPEKNSRLRSHEGDLSRLFIEQLIFCMIQL